MLLTSNEERDKLRKGSVRDGKRTKVLTYIIDDALIAHALSSFWIASFQHERERVFLVNRMFFPAFNNYNVGEKGTEDRSAKANNPAYYLEQSPS